MRGLIFGTSYVDTPERLEMLRLWVHMHQTLNPHCDLLLIDSASPMLTREMLESLGVAVFQFRDNIGHLARGGRDGWGRAFCRGLEVAIDQGYDYVAHVEGDSLMSVPLAGMFELMFQRRKPVITTMVRGTRKMEHGWVETGLMLFEVAWLEANGFIAKYDWERGHDKRYPRTPEWHVCNIVEKDVSIWPWAAERGDRGQIGPSNVRKYVWVTHVDLPTARAFSRNATRNQYAL